MGATPFGYSLTTAFLILIFIDWFKHSQMRQESEVGMVKSNARMFLESVIDTSIAVGTGCLSGAIQSMWGCHTWRPLFPCLKLYPRLTP